MLGHNLPHRDVWVLRVGGGTCVTGLKLSGQLHMVASGWRWLPVLSYLVHEQQPCKANLRWTGVQQGCRADEKRKWAAASVHAYPSDVFCNIQYVFISIYVYNIRYIYTIFSIHISTLYIAYISSHSKGPEQDQLRSPFVPYVRNTAEHSIHNFDSQPYIYM